MTRLTAKDIRELNPAERKKKLDELLNEAGLTREDIGANKESTKEEIDAAAYCSTDNNKDKGYVFVFAAPGLSAVFLGYGNLPVNFSLSRGIDLGLISLLFLFYMVPFVASVLIPVWRVAITEPVEAMK